MLKIKILTIGKTKETWLQHALEEYDKRLKNIIKIEIVCVKDDDQLIQHIDKSNGIILLDPQGPILDSISFSNFFYEKVTENGSQLTFVIGGANGLPVDLRLKYPLLSLSKLTFTHQITRLILIEQIYRAYQINKGTGYHK